MNAVFLRERERGMLRDSTKGKKSCFSKMGCLSANSVFKIPDIKQVFHLWYSKEAKRRKMGAWRLEKHKGAVVLLATDTLWESYTMGLLFLSAYNGF